MNGVQFRRFFTKLPRSCFFMIIIIISLLLLLVADAVSAADQLSNNPFSHWCGDTGNFTINSTYHNNVKTVLSSIESNTSITYGFYTSSSWGQSPDDNTVNAIALCRGDVLDPADCRSCIREAAENLTMLCPVQKVSVRWYEKCMVRYANYPIFEINNPYGDVKLDEDGNSDPRVPAVANEFNETLHGLLNDLRDRAAAGDSMKKFAVGTITKPRIYGLAQCTPDLTELYCKDCLAFVIRNLTERLSQQNRSLAQGALLLGTSCTVRYQTYRFYNEDAPSKGTTLIIVLPIVLVAVSLLVGGMFIWKVRKSNKGNSEIKTAEALQYDLQTLRDATNNFAEENKLGQGGFGAVYKGSLVNGQDIAVKRLGRFSGQGETEFKTEVVLVAALQHRNLVQLLGFCLSGKEMLIVYQYVPNASLDHFIFDQTKRQQLCWERRQNIIQGICRGLVYLHEDSGLRIIHRDLKASNVLLDADMNPKISDFGLARLFQMDQSRDETSRIAGTFSYMAPEYKLYGQLSVKTDVFSFGVLVLEIISGQKNSWGQVEETNSEDLLSRAWRCWREETVANLIDPTMKEVLVDSTMAEMLRSFHVALLCVQQNSAERPSMALVMMMLNASSVTLPLPSQPAIYSVSSQLD